MTSVTDMIHSLSMLHNMKDGVLVIIKIYLFYTNVSLNAIIYLLEVISPWHVHYNHPEGVLDVGHCPVKIGSDWLIKCTYMFTGPNVQLIL